MKGGSIKLFVEGFPEDIKQIVSLIESKEITELSGFTIEEIEIVDESSDAEETTESNNKWSLVKEIVSQPVKGRKLRGADLSGANLSGAYLRSARLVQTNLRSARLNHANLIEANLIGADLSNAQLFGADLTDADLSGAKVENARFGDNSGISESLKRDLIARGAIFEDSPGDRSRVLAPV